jgi:urease accessory protein
MSGTSLAGLLRLADSAFPSGAFSQSFGLESAVAAERVRDESTLHAWLESYLLDAWATLDGAALVLALRDGFSARELDATVTAATHADESRRANARMTRAILDAFAAMGLGGTRLDAYAGDIRGGHASGVPALAFGLAYETLDIDWRDAFVACASATLTSLAAAGTRAIPLGQRATARVLWALRDATARALAEAERAVEPADLSAQAFAQEIDALVHRSLDGRLFAS